MRQLLLFLFLLFLVYYVRRSLAQTEQDQSPAGSSPAADAGKEAERVLPCEHCGLFVPESEGRHADGHFFCSDEHAQRGAGVQR